MTDYSPVNPKPSPGTGVESGEYRDDTIITNTPALENLEELDLSTEENRLKAAYAIGAMGIGSNLGLDAFLAQADLARDGKALWEVEKMKIGSTVYNVSVAASGGNFLLELST